MEFEKIEKLVNLYPKLLKKVTNNKLSKDGDKNGE